MNKEKYKQIVTEEANKVSLKKFSHSVDPVDWSEYRTDLMTFIKEVDAATEVYNLENGKKGA